MAKLSSLFDDVINSFNRVIILNFFLFPSVPRFNNHQAPNASEKN